MTRFLALALLLLSLLPARALSEHAIGPGREQAVLALFAPHGFGDLVASGYTLGDVAIQRDRIVVGLSGPDGDGRLVLVHPSEAPRGAPASQSFGALLSGEPDSEAAERALFERVAANDRGGFWAETSTLPPPPEGRPAPEATPPGPHAPGRNWGSIDGLLVFGLVVVLALLISARHLAREPRWMGPALGGIVVAGLGVRLALAPVSFLGAWPWSRVATHVRSVVTGPVFEELTRRAGEAPYLVDAASWINLGYAAVMPLVLFAHATYLLRDARSGLAAAFAIAFLPQHVRFSRAEDPFIASLVLTSLAFAMLHGWLRDPSPRIRWALLLVLPLVLLPGYLLRPLNLLFVVVYAAAITTLHPEAAPRWRRRVALVVVLGVAALALPVLLENQGDRVAHAITAPGWVVRSVGVLLDPRLLVLSDPLRTPLPLLVLAGLGVTWGWRGGQRRTVGFLLGWLALFLVAHAFVVQRSMQPRYHLHLVVPFLLLGAAAVPRMLGDRRRWLLGAGVWMLTAPLLHRGFIEDLGYTEHAELEFVRAARDRLPAGCTVIEPFGGPPQAEDLRFARIGLRVGHGGGDRFEVVPVRIGEDAAPPLLDLTGRECVVLYEGLACTTWRAQGEAYASTCEQLRAALRAETSTSKDVPVRWYDRANGGEPVFERATVPLRLSRVPEP